MVDALAAGGISVHTSVVELESLGGSVDANGNWADRTDSVHQIVLIATSDANVSCSGSCFVGRAVTARRISAFIRVAAFGIDSTIVFDVVESILDDSTVASTVAVAGAAVDQVLFAHRDQLTSFTEVLSFQSSSGRERPAASALSLILNSGNETLIAPINAGWGFEIVWCHEQRGCGGEIFWDVGLQSSELVSEQITEFVHCHVEADFSIFEASVVGGNFVTVVQEDLHAEDLFGYRVGLAMGALEELPLLVADGCGARQGNCQSQNNANSEEFHFENCCDYSEDSE